MSPMANQKLIEEARRLLADATPLSFDCGTLCGHKCCTDFAPTEGVYLIPGELPLFDGTEDFPTWQFHRTDEYEFAPSWTAKHDHVVFMQCKKVCAESREKRPFECRTYPLLPYLNAGGQLEMRYSFLAEGICPLPERYTIEELQPEFVAAAHAAWSVLMQDEEMLDHIRWVSEQYDALALPLAAGEDEEEAE